MTAPITSITATPTGYLGNLTPDQEDRLQLLWSLLLHLTEASSLGAIEQLVRVNSLHQTKSSTPSTTTTTPSHSRRNSILSRTESRVLRKNSIANISVYHSRLLHTLRNVGLSSSDIKTVRRFLTRMTPEDVRFGILTASKHDPPDAFLLRYLRISKWEVNKAFITLLEALLWRTKEMCVDSQLLPRGELYAAQQEGNQINPFKADVARGFIEQLRMGKAYVHGVDREMRPVVVIRVRLHQPQAQSEDSLNQFITHMIESVRLCLVHPVETSTVIFDMTGFSLANMEYGAVKFIIKCFEKYYPECLGVLLIHNAPKIFAGIWKIIRTWLSPSLAAKIHFTHTIDDLDLFIPRDQVVSELSGLEDWEYEYLEPCPDENHLLNDSATRDALLAERHSISEEFLAATSTWITAAREGTKGDMESAMRERDELAEKLRVNYWDLDPYVRARNWLDRTGVIQGRGGVEFYPVSKAAVVQIQTAKILQVKHVERARVKIVNL